MPRFCCDRTPVWKITYAGGSMGNDEIFVCLEHATKHPFDKRILKQEPLIK